MKQKKVKIISAEKALRYYKNRQFYVVGKTTPVGAVLLGPLDNIYLTAPAKGEKVKKNGYKYVQVINGRIEQAYRADEVVTFKGKPIGARKLSAK